LMRAICYHKQAVKGKLKDMLSFGFCFWNRYVLIFLKQNTWDVNIFYHWFLDEYLDAHVDCPINIVDFGTCEGQTFLPFLKQIIGE
jgi:hypothetical protein